MAMERKYNYVYLVVHSITHLVYMLHNYYKYCTQHEHWILKGSEVGLSVKVRKQGTEFGNKISYKSLTLANILASMLE